MPRKRAIAASSSLWIVWVPQMNRTLARPRPQRVRPSWAARTRVGSSASPRELLAQKLRTSWPATRTRAPCGPSTIRSPFHSPASRMPWSSPCSRSLISPYMVVLPGSARRVAPPDVRRQVLLERPLEVVGRAESPVSPGAGVVDVLGPRVDDGLAARVRHERDPRVREGPAHEVDQLARARVERRDVVDRAAERRRGAVPPGRAGPDPP